MRIGIIRLGAAPVLVPPSAGLFGGTDVRAALFARGLAQQTDHEVIFVVCARRGGIEPIQDRLQVHRVTDRRRPNDRRWDFPSVWQLPWDFSQQLVRSLHRRIRQRPLPWGLCCRLPVDVLATFGVQDPSAAVIEAARRSGKSSVLFLTSDRDVEQAFAAASSPSVHAQRMHKLAILQADVVVAQTRSQQQLVQQFARRDAILIRNPIEVDSAEQPPRSLEHRGHVLWVGRADRDCKRADRCVELAKACPDVRFVAVMNRMAARDYDWLVKHAPRNLRMLERVSWERSDALFREARAVLNTSDHEGFPNTFLQAAKYGCPILSFVVNPDQVLTRYRLGFCAGGDLTRMTEMLCCLWQHPQRFEHVSRAARQYVAVHHEWTARVAEFHTVLQQLQRSTGRLRAA